MKSNIIFLSPYLSPKTWGGKRLKEFNIPLTDEKIGEAWIISGLHDKSSTILGQNVTLDTFYQKNHDFFDNYPAKEYPLLVKLLDCNQDLSIQVHPTEQYAKDHRQCPTKNEAWFVIDAKHNASIIYGHNAKTPQELQQMVQQKKWKELLKNVEVKPQDIYYVPSGTLHALKSGLLIFEVQQSSDCTFRLYDYGRELHDKSRVLHVKQALENITVPFTKPKVKKTKSSLMTPYFNIKVIKNRFNNIYEFNRARWLQCFVLSGTGLIDKNPIKKGDTFIVGNNQTSFNLKGKVQLIVTYIARE